MSQVEQFLKSRSRGRFAALAAAHGDLVFRCAYRVCRDRAAAEDIAQEVFLRLLTEEPREVRSDRGFLAWRAITMARRHLRSAARLQAREEEAMRRKEEASTRPQEARLSMEEALEVQEEVERLPDDVRSPIELHYFSDLTLDEVAEVLGVSRRTVATRLSEGRDRLRARLSPRLVGVLLPAGALEASVRPSPGFRRGIEKAAGALPGLVPPVLLLLSLKTKAILFTASVVLLATAGVGVGMGLWPRWQGGVPPELAGAGGVIPARAIPAGGERATPSVVLPEGNQGPAAGPTPARPTGFGPIRATVRGRLVDGFTGKPIGGQRVAVAPGRMIREEECPSAVTRADGTFGVVAEIDWAPSWSLRISRPGYLSPSVNIEHWGLMDGEIDLGDVDIFRASTVRAVVLDPASQPVTGALVHTCAPADRGSGSAVRDEEVGTTGARGEALSTRVRPQTAYIVATAKGFLPAHTPEPVELLPGREKRVTLRFAEPRRVTVRVVDQAGGLVQGAAVRLSIPFDAISRDRALDAIDRVLRDDYKTDEAGAAIVPAADYPLEVSVWGEDIQRGKAAVPAGDGEVLLTVARSERGASVKGSVAFRGSPVGLFTIKRRAAHHVDWRQDFCGNFRIKTEAGEAIFDITSPEHATTSFALTLKPGEAVNGLQVEMLPGFTVSGRVVAAASGRGVDRARVQLHPIKDGTSSSWDPFAYTARDGSFRVHGLEKGRYEVEVSGEVCGDVEQLEPLLLEGPREGLVLSVPAQRSTLRLRVRDRLGIPAHELDMVEVELKPLGEIPRASGPMLVPGSRVGSSILGVRGWQAFDLTSQVPYQLKVKGYRIHHVLSIPPLATGETRSLDLFPARAVVRGRVLSPAGEAVPHSAVLLRYLPPASEGEREPDVEAEGSRRWDEGQADGSYAIEGCPPGSASLEAEARGFARVVVEVTVPEEGELVQDLVLGLGKQLCGMVSDERGAPIPGAEVEAGGQTSTSDAMGRFCLQGLVEKEVMIRVKKSGWFNPGMPWIRAAPGDEDVRIVLRRGGVVRALLDERASSLKRLSAALITDHGTWTIFDEEERTAVFDEVPPGEYRLVVSAEGRGAFLAPVSVAAGDVRDVEVRFTPPVKIAGKVVAGGKPVAGARLTAGLAVTGRGPRHPPRSILVAEFAGADSGEDGAFEIAPGAVFPLGIAASVKGFVPWERTFATPADLPASGLVVELHAACAVAGKVRAAAGGGPRLVRVALVQSGEERDSTHPGLEGDFELSGADPGSGEVHLSSERSTLRVPVILRRGAPASVDVDLGTAGVRGRVSGVAAGLEMASGHFQSRRTGVTAHVEVHPDGSYEVRGLSEGPCEVSWTIVPRGGETILLKEELVIAAGGTEHDILVPAGRIQGVALGPDGGPLAGVDLRATGERSTRFASARSGESGRFAIEGLSAGAYRVTASRGDVGSTRLDGVQVGEGPGMELRVELKEGVPAAIHLDGDPAEVYGVLVDGDETPVTSPVAPQASVLDFGKVAPGSYRLLLFPVFTAGPGLEGTPLAAPLVVARGAGPPRVALSRGGEIQVTARDGGGRPLAGAEVVLRSGGCRLTEVFRAADAKGVAAFRCHLGGVYEVTARHGGASASRTVEVKDGDVDIGLVLQD